MTDTAEEVARAPKYTAAPQDPMDMLAEEGLEVAHERMKAIRFGWEGTPEWVARGIGSPRDRFIQEVADFQVALMHALDQGKIQLAELNAGIEKKHARLEELFGMKRPLQSLGYTPPGESVNGRLLAACKLAELWLCNSAPVGIYNSVEPKPLPIIRSAIFAAEQSPQHTAAVTVDDETCPGGVRVSELRDKCPKCGATDDDYCRFSLPAPPAALEAK